MKSNLEIAKERLFGGSFTCVIVNGESICTSDKRGVKPLLEWLESGTDFSNFSAADKVVGKAAAFIYVLLGVKEIYANIISKPAIEVFEKFGIVFSYDTCVEAIRNRTNTDFCPMEKATRDIDTPKVALTAIKDTLAKLSQ